MGYVSQAEYPERLNKIVRRIKRKPKCWKQWVYHRGTAHCVAGHAQLDSGRPESAADAWIDGKQWLGLSDRQANYLFMSDRTLKEIEAFANRLVFKSF